MSSAKARPSSRDLILEVASEEFARNGFAGARIDAIAQRTQLNVRMIYYHFQSKEGLYQAVLEAIYRNMTSVVEGGDGLGGADQAGGMPALIAFQRLIDLLLLHPRFADILTREAIDGGKRLEQLFARAPELYERIHHRASQLLQSSIDEGLVRDLDAALAVHSLTSMVCVLVAARASQHLFLGGRQVPPSEWKSTLVDLFIHGLARPLA